MIVISHPWEFVPKGSSHFNYHTTSTSTSSTSTSNNDNANNQNASTGVPNHGARDQAAAATATVPHGGKMVGGIKSRASHMMMAIEENNTSISEFTSGFYGGSRFAKSPLVKNLNFELAHHAYSSSLPPPVLSLSSPSSSSAAAAAAASLSFDEKWHLKQVNEFCENEIFIKDNKVILSYGYDNDSKIVKRSFTFDAPVFDVSGAPPLLSLYILSVIDWNIYFLFFVLFAVQLV